MAAPHVAAPHVAAPRVAAPRVAHNGLGRVATPLTHLFLYVFATTLSAPRTGSETSSGSHLMLLTKVHLAFSPNDQKGKETRGRRSQQRIRSVYLWSPFCRCVSCKILLIFGLRCDGSPVSHLVNVNSPSALFDALVPPLLMPPPLAPPTLRSVHQTAPPASKRLSLPVLRIFDQSLSFSHHLICKRTLFTFWITCLFMCKLCKL